MSSSAEARFHIAFVEDNKIKTDQVTLCLKGLPVRYVSGSTEGYTTLAEHWHIAQPFFRKGQNFAIQKAGFSTTSKLGALQALRDRFAEISREAHQIMRLASKEETRIARE